MTILISENVTALVRELAEKFFILASEKTSANETFSVALPGGNTPRTFFAHLANHYSEKINWKKVAFYWGDERCVPPDDPDSNYGMVKSTLIPIINIPPQNIHRIFGENEPEGEAVRYSDEILKSVRLFNGFPSFDLIILGLGDDGHTVSLFPDQISLIHSDKICISTTHPVTKQKRISLSMKTINSSRNIIFLVTGKNKSEKVNSIIKNLPESINFPASFVNPVEGKLFWFIDKEASVKLI